MSAMSWWNGPLSLVCVVCYFPIWKSVPMSVAELQPIWLLRGQFYCCSVFFLLCNAQYYCLNKQDLGVSNSSHFWPPSFVLVFSWNGEFGAEYEHVWRSLRYREASWLLDASRKDIFEKCFLDPPLTQRQAHSSLFPTRANQTFMSRECVFSGLDPKQCCSRVLERLM